MVDWLPWAGAGVALAASWLLNPVAAAVCRRCGWIDRADGVRKLQTRGVPLSGGYAIGVAILLGLGLALALAQESMPGWQGMAAGGLVALGLGLLDDGLMLGLRNKLLLQILAAVLAWGGGIRIAGIHLPGLGGWELPALVSLALTVWWIVACMNAVNFLDGLDGLAGGVCLISALALSSVGESPMTVCLGLAVAGACGGFLIHNWHPARLYMGDAGSMLLGFVLGAGWIQAVTGPDRAWAPLSALASLGLPLLDLIFTVCRRFASRLPLTAAEGGHLHHVLIRRGMSVRQVCWLFCGLALIHGLAAWLTAGLNERLAWAAVAAAWAVTVTVYIRCRVVDWAAFTRRLTGS